MTSVDIHDGSVVALDAEVALRIAAEHGVHDAILHLLPHAVCEPANDRNVHPCLRTALRMVGQGPRAEEGRYRVDEAKRWAARQGLAHG